MLASNARSARQLLIKANCRSSGKIASTSRDFKKRDESLDCLLLDFSDALVICFPPDAPVDLGVWDAVFVD
jgi:hypothetical protein